MSRPHLECVHNNGISIGGYLQDHSFFPRIDAVSVEYTVVVQGSSSHFADLSSSALLINSDLALVIVRGGIISGPDKKFDRRVYHSMEYGMVAWDIESWVTISVAEEVIKCHVFLS